MKTSDWPVAVKDISLTILKNLLSLSPVPFERLNDVLVYSSGSFELMSAIELPLRRFSSNFTFDSSIDVGFLL